MESFCWPKRETEASEFCGQRSKEVEESVVWAVGLPRPMERVASAKGHGTLAQHERTDRVQNRLKLREGVGGRANPRGR